MSVSYTALIGKIQSFATAHFQIKRVAFDFDEQAEDFYTADGSYPAMFISLDSSSPEVNSGTITINVQVLDLIQEGRQNINSVVSDCSLICNDFYLFIAEGTDTSVGVQTAPTITTVNNSQLDYCAGASMGIVIDVDTYGYCAIPMGTIPTPESACLPVEIFENDVLVDTVESGGTYSYTSGVCDDATVENSNATFTQTIPSGDTYVLDDYEFEFQDSEGNILDTEIRPAMVAETFLFENYCPTQFSYGLFVNGVSYGTILVNINEDINIIT